MFFKNFKKTGVTEIELDKTVTDNKKDVYEKDYIWVEGYKITDKDMVCRNYQYKMNENFVYSDGEPKLCCSGFHFCLKLEDVLLYRNSFFDDRIFKVRGLVKKSYVDDALNKEKDSLMQRFLPRDSKVTAKEIIFLEELNNKDIYNLFNTSLSFEEFQKWRFKDKEYRIYKDKKDIEKWTDLGFSEIFVVMLKDNYKREIFNSEMKYDMAKALFAENCSKDYIIYKLLENCN